MVTPSSPSGSGGMTGTPKQQLGPAQAANTGLLPRAWMESRMVPRTCLREELGQPQVTHGAMSLDEGEATQLTKTQA